MYHPSKMVLLLLFLLADPATIAEVDRLFGYGEDHAHESEALQILERATRENPNDYDLLWRIARSYYYTGVGMPPKDRIAYFERGIETGKRAVAQSPERVEGHFWLAASWGGFCQEKGGLTAFRNVKNVRTEMEAVVRLDAAYQEGSAYTALGEIDRQLPGLFGGNLKRGIATLEQGIKVGPRNPEIRVALAESYLEAKRKEEARLQLRQSLELELTPARAFIGRKAQEKARQLLARLDKK
jgi:tetratricopeptide (TPR) repeat protein